MGLIVAMSTHADAVCSCLRSVTSCRRDRATRQFEIAGRAKVA